jgi:signal transduction histidine kinase
MLTRPLREMILATRQIALGNLDLHLPVRSRDELGELAHSFNQMSADLARARELRQQMTADIAHELRTPLSVILSHSEALCDGVLPPKQDTFVLLRDEAYQLGRLVEDLRLLSLADAQELTLMRRAVRPFTLIQQLVASQALKAKKQVIDFVVDVPTGLPEIDVDPDRVIQVISNLLSNALNHTPPGGRVVLTGRSSADRQSVVFCVQDSGPGVSPKELPHIFERFYRADKSRQRDGGSTGLGLAITKSLTNAHGGKIWVENRPGDGAAFYVEFPIA